MINFLQKYKITSFLLVLLLTGTIATHAQVTFRASAPNGVVKGEQFRLSYTLNQEGKDLRLPDLKGFEVLFGPSTSRSFSQQTINGKTTSENSVTYTYILVAPEEGTFTIEPASITVDGGNYRSNSLTIKVLPPDKAAENRRWQFRIRLCICAKRDSYANDAFITLSYRKTMFMNRKDLRLLRLYTTLNITDLGKIEFPN